MPAAAHERERGDEHEPVLSQTASQPCSSDDGELGRADAPPATAAADDDEEDEPDMEWACNKARV